MMQAAATAQRANSFLDSPENQLATAREPKSKSAEPTMSHTTPPLPTPAKEPSNLLAVCDKSRSFTNPTPCTE